MSRTIRKVPKHKWTRHGRTQQERAISNLHEIEGIKVRPKRNRKNLPSSYDDKTISAVYEIRIDKK